MFAVISPEKIAIPPGSVFQIPGNWNDYEALSQQLGDRSIPRLKYRPGEIWLMSPLAEHGRNASLIADIVKAILDHLGKEYDSFTPITMKLPHLHCSVGTTENLNPISPISSLCKKLIVHLVQ